MRSQHPMRGTAGIGNGVQQLPARSRAPGWTASTTSSPIAADSGQAFRRLGVALVVFDIFLMQSRIGELVPTKLGPISLITVVRIAGMLALVLSGGLNRTLATGSGKAFLLFTIWMAAGGPFSVWRQITFTTFTKEWLPSLFLYCSVTGLLVTVTDLRKAMKALWLALAVVVLMGTFVSRTQEYDRVVIGGGVGSLGNANDMALFLLMGLPAAMLAVRLSSGVNWFHKAIAWVSIPLAIILAIRTGSRAGLLVLCVIFLIQIWAASPAGKLGYILAVGAVGLLILVTTPRTALVRLATILPASVQPMASSSIEGEIRNSAEDSQNSRRMLLERGLQAALRRPVFGVGAGAFMAADSMQAEREARSTLWRGTHNTYVQILAETGFPGFACYVFAILSALFAIISARKLVRQSGGDPQLSALTLCVLTIAVGQMAGITFGQLAYLPSFPLALALLHVAARAVRQELAAAPAPLPPSLFPAPFSRGLVAG